MLNPLEGSRVRGIVKFFNVGKGFGFCHRPDGDRDVFLHASVLKRCGVKNVLQPGDELEFTVRLSDKGPVAEDIQVLALTRNYDE